MKSNHWITEQNDPGKERFTERERRILDDLIAAERLLTRAMQWVVASRYENRNKAEMLADYKKLTNNL
jgi:hypothetical protein